MYYEDLEIGIYRDEFKQIESAGNLQNTYAISWKNDCQYRLELIKTNDSTEVQSIKIWDVEIINTSKDTCFIITTSPGLDFEDRSWIKKLE